MKKQNQTYNDGILELLVQQTLYDRYHTKIGSDYSTFKRFWFRKLGITSEEQYFAMQVDTVVIMRVAISKTIDINSHMKVKINGKVYGISRVYHNYNKNETELSLFEVVKDERKK
ncbi:phage head closure protein [Staphylococcus aureus]|uniref:phage head closure protein n=1 Tax=Staphylococcus aureus TaxID=1280 RepID=UPI0010FEB6E4|nr:phage head closure protein [Staphylococcus aureus]TLG83864.1 phage head-tail adapter protein [Staphylococcus aureus]